MALTWNDLFLRGSIVTLATCEWPGRLGLRASDLGIPNTTDVSQALSLGSHRLAPRAAYAEIHRITNKAKRAVEEHSMRFGFLWGSSYVPAEKLVTLVDTLRAIKAEYDRAVTEFVDGYDSMKREMFPIIKRALEEAAKTKGDAATALARVQSEYPPADVVRARFGISWSVYAIQGPSVAGAEDALSSEGMTVKGVVGDMIGQLRTEVTEKMDQVMAVLKKSGNLPLRTLESAKAALDRVESLNVLGDTDLSKQLRTLRTLLATAYDAEKVPDSAIDALSNLKATIESGAAEATAAAEAKLTGGRRKLKAA